MHKITQTSQSLAEAFRHFSPKDAIAQFPELRNVYTVVSLMEEKLIKDGITPKQQNMIMAQVRNGIASKIEQGKINQIDLKQVLEILNASSVTSEKA